MPQGHDKPEIYGTVNTNTRDNSDIYGIVKKKGRGPADIVVKAKGNQDIYGVVNASKDVYGTVNNGQNIYGNSHDIYGIVKKADKGDVYGVYGGGGEGVYSSGEGVYGVLNQGGGDARREEEDGSKRVSEYRSFNRYLSEIYILSNI